MAHTDNVVGFWDLKDDADDDSGNANHGTNTDGTFDGIKWTGNGTTAHIALPDSLPANYLTGGQYTISVWVILADGSEASFVKNWGSDTSGAYHFGVLTGAIDSYLTEGGGATKHSATYSHSAFTLYNAVSVADGSNFHLYINGSEVGTQVAYDGTLKTDFIYTGIGAKPFDNGTYGDRFITGSLRAVALYNVGKDSTWITEEYNSGTPKYWSDWQGAAGQPAVKRQGGVAFMSPGGYQPGSGQMRWRVDPKTQLFLPGR